LETTDLNPPTPVPQSVTRRQARQALLLAGVLGQVQPAIDAIQDPLQRGLVQIEWDDSLTFDRHRPTLMALAAALGMDDEALDQLFTTAAEL
jgi:DnaJ-domain-containing protein 1